MLLALCLLVSGAMSVPPPPAAASRAEGAPRELRETIPPAAVSFTVRYPEAIAAVAGALALAFGFAFAGQRRRRLHAGPAVSSALPRYTPDRPPGDRAPADRPSAVPAPVPAAPAHFAPEPESAWPVHETAWTCRIAWEAGRDGWRFVAMAAPPGAPRPEPIATSAPLRWPAPEPSAREPGAVAALDDLVAALTAVGWRLVAPAERWYERRLIWERYTPPSASARTP